MAHDTANQAGSAAEMSGIGTNRTSQSGLTMSVLEGKARLAGCTPGLLTLAQSKQKLIIPSVLCKEINEQEVSGVGRRARV